MNEQRDDGSPSPAEPPGESAASVQAATMAARVQDVLIEEEMKDSYLRYAMSVIVSRALPDVRDGLKPSQRRILVAMNDLGIGPRGRRTKCASIVGETMKKYHPHGDQAIYPTLVRMAQDWNIRYRLVEPQGNFGSLDGDPPAAMRYTEARLEQLAVELLADLDKDTVDFVPNFDETELEPTVLPGRFPNLLVNGAQGIAVGMATSIPPHNLREVAAGLRALLDDPAIEVEQLLEHIPGPDFPTGGLICGRGGVLEAYRTGRGRLICRGRVAVEQTRSGRTRIVIHEIPYQVNKAELVKKIAALVHEGKLEGIAGINDESDKREPVRIVIELKRDADPNVVVNLLYKHTPLQSTFSVIMIALVGGRPELLDLKGLLTAYLEHRREVIRRRTRFLLEKAEARKHVVEGLRIAVDHIDAVIALIRAAESAEAASLELQARFGLSERQAEAILAMQLRRLTGLERQKLEEEYRALLDEIADLRDILARRERVDDLIRADLEELAARFGDERRTGFTEPVSGFEVEDLIPEQLMVVTRSHLGYVKATPLAMYRSQGRGGKGIAGAATREGDFLEDVFVANTHDVVLFFTNYGRVYSVKVYELPEMARTAMGRALINVIPLQQGERVTACMPVDEIDDRDLVFVTEQGLIKKTPLSAFANVLTRGIIAIGLQEGDRLIEVRLARPEQEIVIATRNGRAIRFAGEEVRRMGRSARGVRGIRLAADDRVVSMAIRDEGTTLLTVTENGYGKRTEFEDYRLTRRGGQGVRNIKTGGRNGRVVGVRAVLEDDEVMLISQSGQLIRIPVAEIRTIGRNTMGVRLMDLKPGDRLVSVAVSAREEISDEQEQLLRQRDAERAAARAAAARARPAQPHEDEELAGEPEAEDED
ncbi:MAG: DNA gyrase subunit A [Planctomycetota bacterium]|nr:MAG: DNA gyrase subunit A [Planctomycetota bacterium]